MSQFPTNKTVPLDKDIAVSEAKPEILGTGAREQLSVVLDTIDQKLKQEQDDRIADVDEEQARAEAAEAALDAKIDQEIADRIADVDAEESRATAAEAAEAATRLEEDTELKAMIDGERSPLRVTSVSGTTVTLGSAKGYRYDSDGVTTNLIVPNGSFASDFDGATIDFAAGTIEYADTGIPNQTFGRISFAGHGGEWASYAIVLLPGEPNTLLIVNGDTFGSTNESSLIPAFSGGIPVAAINVQDNGSGGQGTIESLSNINTWEMLSSGTGNGSGSGSPLDPNPEETFVYYTRSDFAVDGKKFVGSTTGTDQVLGLGRVVLGSGQQFNSSDLTGPQHKIDALTINTVQGKLLYADGKVDESPVVEFTRDGGSTWQAASINLPGSTSAADYVGNIIEANYTFADVNPLFNGGTASGAYSSGQRIAAMFTPDYNMILSAFSMEAMTSSTAGSIVGRIMSVSSGTPQAVISTSAQIMVAAHDINGVLGSKTFSFDPISLTGGTQYALVIEGSGLNAALQVPTVAAAPAFSTGSSAHNGSGWVASGSDLAYKVLGSGCDLRMRITSGTAGSELKGFGINYVSDSDSALTGQHSYEERVISASEASTGLITFSSIYYTPGAHQLMCHFSGHLFMSPDFTEIGVNQVKFPANFFSAGDTVRFFTAYGLVDGTSHALSKIASIYTAIVGSALQVSMGVATHSSLSSALAAAPSGAKILVLSGTHAGNVDINSDITVEGQGHGTVLSGDVALSGSYASIKNLMFGGNLSVTGSGNFVKECFASSTSTITDSGSANKKEIIQE